VLSKDILWILRPTYSEAWIAACILALRGVIGIFGNISSTAIAAKDEFDSHDSISMKDFVRSKIFLLNKIGLILASLYIASVAGSLTITQNMGKSIIENITIIAVIALAFTVMSSLINMNLLKKFTIFKLNYKPLLKYIFSSCTMTITIYFLRSLFEPPSIILDAIGRVFLLTAIGALIYGLILYFVSHEFRRYLMEVYSYIMKMKNSL